MRIEPLNPAVSGKLANLSFLAACLVAAIHLPDEAGTTAYTLVRHWLLGPLMPAAVPFFFAVAAYMLGGHLAEPGWWGTALRKRVRTLLVPYAALNLLYFALRLGVNLLSLHKSADGVRALDLSWRMPFEVFGLVLPDGPENFPLWFVRCLLFFIVISPLLAAPVRRSRAAAFALCAGALALDAVNQLLPALGLPLPPTLRVLFDYGVSLRGLAFFALGLSLRGWLPCPNVKPCLGLPLFVGGALLAASVLRLGAHTPFAALLPFALLAVVAGAWGLIPARRLPSVLTKSSFAVYALHMLVVHFGCVGLRGTGLWRALFTAPGYLLFWLVCVALSVLAAALCRAFTPALSRILFGGR